MPATKSVSMTTASGATGAQKVNKKCVNRTFYPGKSVGSNVGKQVSGKQVPNRAQLNGTIKKRKVAQATKDLRSIKHAQLKSTELILTKTSVAQMMRKALAQNMTSSSDSVKGMKHIESAAFQLVRESLEQTLITILENGTYLTRHGNRITTKAKDIQMSHRVTGTYDTLSMNNH